MNRREQTAKAKERRATVLAGIIILQALCALFVIGDVIVDLGGGGQMAEVMEGFFEDWNLTPAERDVAIMILKGIENEAIANVRNTAPGTVRAQATSIYTKSGTHGRAQFVSLCMEELMSADLFADEANNGHDSALA
ncbi:helix-turn-helix transcriptional regulator [Ruegeria sediminis]|uniref:Helix-turn-helix transcriptional regulator n=1 Tax=Ruegeria sediminis TaxID=2583820 RepID=A0ABY2X063_9RHOB|nr:helix-turn-helix transcriptional regulator [Ruegeria sediminis]TMV08595.1 helix-turn-helix transcriptional regulator [Ruegeria sediminis]